MIARPRRRLAALTTLPPAAAARLRLLAPTYPVPADGAPVRLADPFPARAHTFRHDAPIGRGTATFARAREELLSWEVQRRAGIVVAASHPRVRAAEPDDGAVVARLTIVLGPLRLQAPCRVVEVIDEPRRAGFGYGTLAGHPEAGAEWFVLTHGEDDVVRMVVTAFSRPAGRVARLAPPLTERMQDLMARRYLRALAAPPS